MSKPPLSDPIPSIIETWTEQLAATRAQLHTVLAALAHIQAAQTDQDVVDLIDIFDSYFDSRFQRYRDDTIYDLEQETEDHLLAMLRSAAAMHTDVQLLKSICIESVAALTDTPMDTIYEQVDQARRDHLQEFPPPEHTPHILRSFFRKKDT